MGILAGIHPVREALLSDQAIDRVLIAKGSGGPRIQEIVDLCRNRSVPVRFEERKALDRVASTHQGVVALGAAARYTKADEAFEQAKMVVVLDGIEDPHNLGAIIRTAHAAGVESIVIPERRAASVTDTVAKAAAGALAHMRVVKVANIGQTLDSLKSRGYWIYGLDERGKDTYDEVDYAAPSALVLGAEGKGLHEHVKKRCDFLVRIPLAGKISSLNVSVAAGIALFAWKRRRDAEAR